MFETHQPAIGRWARDHEDNLADVIKFVVHTIQCPLVRAVEDFQAGDLRTLSGNQRASLEYVDAFKQRIFEDASEVSHNPDALLLVFAALPGLGLAKAGFCCQLSHGVSACLDSHNLKRFGISPWKFAHVKRGSAKRRDQRAAEYNATCEKLGGTAGLWDTWCQYVADNQPKRYDSAETVSRLHAEAFNLV